MPMDSKTAIYSMNTIELAYLGDSIWEAFVRARLVRRGSFGGHADKLHRAGVRYVNAGAQAAVIKELLPKLGEQEQALVRRARNHKIATKAKNAGVMDYKWATAFEALVGALYLAEEPGVLDSFMEEAAGLVENGGNRNEQSR